MKACFYYRCVSVFMTSVFIMFIMNKKNERNRENLYMSIGVMKD